MKIRSYLLLMLLILTAYTSSQIKEKKTVENSKKFKTTGFYYSLPKKAGYDRSKFYIFYENGLFWGGLYVGKSKEEIKTFLLNKNAVQIEKSSYRLWGKYSIKNDTISFNNIANTDNTGNLITFKYFGEIINNEKIVINYPLVEFGHSAKYYKKISTKTEYIIDTLYFCPFENKPDSINNHIK